MLWRVVAALAFCAWATCSQAGGETVVVGPSDGSCPGAIASRIQSALDAAVPGSTVVVCPGTYAEQLVVTKRVTLRASPGVRLRAGRLTPAASSLRSGRPVAAVITVRSRATIEGFSVDAIGNGIVPCDGTEPLLAGIFVRSGGVAILGNAIAGVRLDGAPAGCTNGVGILAEGAGGGTLRLEGNTVADYRGAGIVVDAPGSTVRVRQNLVIGAGIADGAQIGIDVHAGSRVQLDENVVRDQSGTGGDPCDLGVGIALRAPRTRLHGNQLQANPVGIHAAARGHRLLDDGIDGGAVGVVGLWIDGDETRVTRATVNGHAAAGVVVDGNRNTLRSPLVSDVHDGPRCAPFAECAPSATERCGVGLWLRGRANRLTGPTTLGVDASVVDDGRANSVR